MKKKIVALLLALSMVAGLCACGGETNTDQPNNGEAQSEQENDESEGNNENETEENEELEEGMAIYKITVVDEDGEPVVGAYVQLCLDACVFAETNAEGVAEFTLEEADGYKAEVLSLPEGYEVIDAEPVYLEGKTELTLTVKKVQ